MSRERENLIGMKSGRLTVVEFYDRNKWGQSRWLCKCECGNTSVVSSSNIKYKKTLSCGCLCKERVSEAKRTHGMSYSSIYPEYHNMKKRCYDENTHNYKWYGGRGIKVCDRWLTDIHNFYDDVSILPHFREEGYTLDRIDNNGDYEPSNVRWATKSEQCNNRRSNLLYEYDGEVRTLKEISDITGLPYKALHKRLKIFGWEPERAFSEELRKVSNPYAGDKKTS